MPLWLPGEPLVLASKSEARRRMLAAAGLPVEVRPADLDERAIERKLADRPLAEVALKLSEEKAGAIAARLPGRIVVGADQVLALGVERLSKPADRAAAAAQLRALRGRTHTLYSAVTLLRDGAMSYRQVDTAQLTMRDFSDDFLETYLDIAMDQATESVGAYQLERTGIHLFERVDGDHFVILGMPLLPLLAFLRDAGLLKG
jgi:septum formation protein